jgi:hypothetical protein
MRPTVSGGRKNSGDFFFFCVRDDLAHAWREGNIDLNFWEPKDDFGWILLMSHNSEIMRQRHHSLTKKRKEN